MTYLLLQIFLLMLGVFLLGALLASAVRKRMHTPKPRDKLISVSPETLDAGQPEEPPQAVSAETLRFERALTGPEPVFTPLAHQDEAEVAAKIAAPTSVVAPTPAATLEKSAGEPPTVESGLLEPIVPKATDGVSVTAPLSTPDLPDPSDTFRRDEDVRKAPVPQVSMPLPPSPSMVVDAPKPQALADFTALAQAAKTASEERAAKIQARFAQSELPAEKPIDAPPASKTTGAEDAVTSPPEVLSKVAATPDDLTRIRGIDPLMNQRLADMGVTSFAAIAGWTGAEVAQASAILDVRGLIEQQNWIEQATLLAAGKETRYSREPRVVQDSTPAKDTDAPSVAMATPVAVVVVPRASEVPRGPLENIIGITPDLAQRLLSHGVTSVTQIAAWADDDVRHFELLLGRQGSIGSENWVGQARYLSKPAESPPPDQTTSVMGAALAAVSMGAAMGAASMGAALGATSGLVAGIRGDNTSTLTVQASLPKTVEATSEGATSGVKKTNYLGFRSVRSEALVGKDASDRFSDQPAHIPGDDLKRIRGIGVIIERKLYSLAITTYDEIANWTRADVDRISRLLDFSGRIERENWIEQARILSSDGATSFSRRFDRNDA